MGRVALFVPWILSSPGSGSISGQPLRLGQARPLLSPRCQVVRRPPGVCWSVCSSARQFSGPRVRSTETAPGSLQLPGRWEAAGERPQVGSLAFRSAAYLRAILLVVYLLAESGFLAVSARTFMGAFLVTVQSLEVCLLSWICRFQLNPPSQSSFCFTDQRIVDFA